MPAVLAVGAGLEKVGSDTNCKYSMPVHRPALFAIGAGFGPFFNVLRSYSDVSYGIVDALLIPARDTARV